MTADIGFQRGGCLKCNPTNNPVAEEIDLSRFPPEAREAARMLHLDRTLRRLSSAYHEAGHAIGFLHYGRAVEHLRLGPQPSCIPAEGAGDVTEEAVCVPILCGRVAQAYRTGCIFRPRLREVAVYLDKAKAHGGNCDECRVLHVLMMFYGHDHDLIGAYQRHEDRAVDLIQRPHVWKQLACLADALTGRDLDRAEIEALVDVPALRRS